MKKLVTIAICLALLASCLAGCASQSPSPSSSPSPSENSPSPPANNVSPEPTPSEEPSPPEESDGNGNGGAGGGLEGSLEDIIQKIYDKIDPSVEMPFTMNTELSEDMGVEEDDFRAPIEYFIFAKGIPFSKGVASEAAIGAIPYSLVLLRLESGANVEDVKKTIRDNANPAKWICVGVDPGDVIVDNIGDLVVLIMSDNSKAIHEAFLKLAE
ncbi:MAG: hypothetical protein LBI19_09595 [Oscillospiraceae bacterium]|jgi:hypothetical protein|nr:hypothetical protein [Oscillospiraceae bacterium]